MDNSTTIDIYKYINEKLEDSEVAEVLETIGYTVGLLALQLEKQNGIDRNQTFKVITRQGHSTIKMMEGKTNA